MTLYNVHDAKTNLSKLIERAEAGEEVIIARRDMPAVRLVPVVARVPKRKFGACKGQATVTESFFDPLPVEELALWECESGGGAPEPARKAKRRSRRA
jgi:prevent-host-death family protein